MNAKSEEPRVPFVSRQGRLKFGKAYYQHGKEFGIRDYVDKISVDGLRGHHLTTDSNDEFWVYRNFYDVQKNGLSRTTYFHLYVSKASQMTQTEVIRVFFRLSMSSATPQPEEVYLLSISKQNSKFTLKLDRKDKTTGDLIESVCKVEPTISKSGKWLHIALGLGSSMISTYPRTNPPEPYKGQFKFYESLVAYYDGSLSEDFSSYLFDQDILSMMDMDSAENSVLNVEVKATLNSLPGMGKVMEEKYGLRIFDSGIVDGGFPAFNYSRFKGEFEINRCLFRSNGRRKCLVYAFLNETNERSENFTDLFYSITFTTEWAFFKNCPLESCHYCQDLVANCMIPDKEYNTNLYCNFLRTEHRQMVKKAEFEDPASELHLDYKLFTNKQGLKYYLKCPIECIILFYHQRCDLRLRA
jgi:hypothetical protein